MVSHKCQQMVFFHTTTTTTNTTTNTNTTTTTNTNTTTNTTRQNLLETRLEWSQSLVPNGDENNQILDTVLYRHPTYEQLLQVKQARYSLQLKIQKRTYALMKEKAQLLKNISDAFEKKKIEDSYAEKLEEMKRNTKPDKTLTADEIKLVRELYAQDPYANTTQTLAQRFNVKPLYIVQVVDNLILESKAVEEKKKEELRALKIRNQNKPKKSTRKVHQKY
jgi:hypothetical protein